MKVFECSFCCKKHKHQPIKDNLCSYVCSYESKQKQYLNKKTFN